MSTALQTRRRAWRPSPAPPDPGARLARRAGPGTRSAFVRRGLGHAPGAPRRRRPPPGSPDCRSGRRWGRRPARCGRCPRPHPSPPGRARARTTSPQPMPVPIFTNMKSGTSCAAPRSRSPSAITFTSLSRNTGQPKALGQTGRPGSGPSRASPAGSPVRRGRGPPGPARPPPCPGAGRGPARRRPGPRPPGRPPAGARPRGSPAGAGAGRARGEDVARRSQAPTARCVWPRSTPSTKPASSARASLRRLSRAGFTSRSSPASSSRSRLTETVLLARPVKSDDLGGRQRPLVSRTTRRIRPTAAGASSSGEAALAVLVHGPPRGTGRMPRTPRSARSSSWHSPS